MNSIILSLHILGALYTGLLLLQSGFAVYKNKTEKYRNFAIQIIVMLFIQILSGCMLSLQSSHGITITDFCSRIGVYVGSIAVIESMLFWKMYNKKTLFPKVFVSSVGFASILIAISTAVYMN